MNDMDHKGQLSQKSLTHHHQHRQTQQSIVDAAVAVFNQRGYDATSMDNIAEFAGVSRPALYHHAPSKQELLRLALEPLLSALEKIGSQPQAQLGPVPGRLEFVIRRMVEVLTGNVPSAALLLHLRGHRRGTRCCFPAAAPSKTSSVHWFPKPGAKTQSVAISNPIPPQSSSLA
nr:helix-turn-helix domain-containing protein [Arthrobacter sp. PvP023]